MSPYTRRGRSGLIGFTFLGISILLALGTLLLAVTDRSLTDLDSLFKSDDASGPSENTDSATSPLLTPTPDPTQQPPDFIDADADLTARSVYAVHSESDTVLYEREPDQPLQPASTAKIFAALVVLEYATPEEVIEISESDVVDPVAESSMGLEAGDWVTVHDLLVGLMLPSGNDAANALSRTIGARIDGEDDESYDNRFVREMNRIAQDLGLESTTLQHAAGYDREEQSVTARELAIAAEALLESPSLETIVAMKRAEIRVGGDNPRVLAVDNTNELLVHEDVYGIKTGTTAEAGECLVVAYRYNDSTIIAVFLGSEDRYGDARTLLDLPEPPEPVDDEQDELHPEHTDPVEGQSDSDG